MSKRGEISLITSLNNSDKNPRHITPSKLDALNKSLAQFGDLGGIVLNVKTKRLVGGHQRIASFKQAEVSATIERRLPKPDKTGTVAYGFIEMHGTRFSYREVNWPERRERLANIAANKHGGTFDDTALSQLLNDLQKSSELDLSLIGFDQAEYDGLIARLTPPQRTIDAEPQMQHAEKLRKKWKVKHAQIWQLSDHKIMCGDSRDKAHVEKLLAGETINLAFTSPPYASQRDYDRKSGFRPIKADEYIEWFAPIAETIKEKLAQDGSWFINIKPDNEGLDTSLYVFELIIAHVKEWGWHYATEFCWERIGIPVKVKGRFKNQFEPIYQFVKNRWKVRPESVMHDSDASMMSAPRGHPETWQGEASTKNRSNDKGDFNKAYPGNMLPPFGGSHKALGHSAAFPIGLPQWFIKAFSDKGDIIYDPFTGSGSTIIAAENEKRKGRGMEISASYTAVALQRYLDATNETPYLLA